MTTNRKPQGRHFTLTWDDGQVVNIVVKDYHHEARVQPIRFPEDYDGPVLTIYRDRYTIGSSDASVTWPIEDEEMR